jgi:hypothetical protein
VFTHTGTLTHTCENEKQQFPFFAANRKRKWQSSVCLLQTATENRIFVFLGRQTINGYRRFAVSAFVPIYDSDAQVTQLAQTHVHMFYYELAVAYTLIY